MLVQGGLLFLALIHYEWVIGLLKFPTFNIVRMIIIILTLINIITVILLVPVLITV